MSALLAHIKAARALAIACARESDRLLSEPEGSRTPANVQRDLIAGTVLGAQARAYHEAAAKLEEEARQEASGNG